MFHDNLAMRILIHAFPKCKAAALPLVRPVWCVVDDDDDISEVVKIYIYIQECLTRISASSLIILTEIRGFPSVPRVKNFG